MMMSHNSSFASPVSHPQPVHPLWAHREQDWGMVLFLGSFSASWGFVRALAWYAAQTSLQHKAGSALNQTVFEVPWLSPGQGWGLYLLYSHGHFHAAWSHFCTGTCSSQRCWHIRAGSHHCLWSTRPCLGRIKPTNTELTVTQATTAESLTPRLAQQCKHPTLLLD